MSLLGLLRAVDHTHINTFQPHTSYAAMHLCKLTHCWNSFNCYSFPLTGPFFFSLSLMSSQWRLPVVLLPSCQVCGQSFFPPALSLHLFLFYHTTTYSQFSNHCLSASRWYVKPPHCQDIQHMRINDLHVSIGAYSCGAYIVRTLQWASKYHWSQPCVGSSESAMWKWFLRIKA